MKLIQYPINKIIPSSDLSNLQLIIRKNSIKENVENQICTECYFALPITEFYFVNKEKKRRQRKCRDCNMKKYKKVVTIGKYRFADKIKEKGFRTCSKCRDILPISEFYKNGKKLRASCKKCFIKYTYNRIKVK